MPNPIDPRENETPLDGALLVDPGKRFSAACLAAVREFRHAKPWRGTEEERVAKFQTLHAALCDAYGIVPVPELRFIALGQLEAGQTSNAGIVPGPDGTPVVVIVGKLSVASYLFAFAKVRGLDTEEAFRWSLSLFARMFPRSFANCHFDGPILVRNDE